MLCFLFEAFLLISFAIGLGILFPFSLFPSSVVRKHHVFGFALDTAKLRTQ